MSTAATVGTSDAVPAKKRPRSPRAKQRERAAQRTFETIACEICGLSEHDAPIATRWKQGMAFVMCHHCWLRPRPEDQERLSSEIARRSHADGEGARLDREEMAIELAEWVSFYVAANGGRHKRPDLGDAAAELDRIRRHLKYTIPIWRTLRAARAAHARGLIPMVDETRREIAPLVEVERDALTRDLFSGYFRSLDIPAEYEDWFFDSVVAGGWLPTSRDSAKGHRIEPRIGPFRDLSRRHAPPCITWGRHTEKTDRGTGRWVRAQNVSRGWGKAKKAIRDLALAPAEEQAFHAAFVDLARTAGLPKTDNPRARFGLDREHVKYLLHQRLCELCASGTGRRAPRAHGRKSHLFRCLDANDVEARPLLSWIDDQLGRCWNDGVFFWAAMGTFDPQKQT